MTDLILNIVVHRPWKNKQKGKTCNWCTWCPAIRYSYTRSMAGQTKRLPRIILLFDSIHSARKLLVQLRERVISLHLIRATCTSQ
jgi:hypothetical protein